ncbi:MAG: TonB-dependent receptor [Tannerella sp.]|jgi:TonB-linked SusC/RagA family outer membrane protein|nr:TonB-dependent receptor [Tannerella sp.]
MKKIFILTLALLFLGSTAMWAQEQIPVQGVVTDESGEPLIGATVVEAGTNNAGITGMDGRFTLTAKAGAVLQVAYLGYLTEEVTVTGSELTIVMKEDAQSLAEVVVVGYGVQKKSDVTGSVTSVSKDRLSKLPVTNVLQALQGAAAGVTVSQASSVPGDAPTAMVRGRNSINASSDPYIVVDGIPLSKTDGSLNDINPNDIESMEILKDASAVAIYGTNGANGVILITTKRGTTGKPVVRYNGYAGVEEIAHFLDPGSPEQLIDRYAEYSRITGTPLYNNTAVQWQYELDNYNAGRTIDWMDQVIRTGVIQNHNLSLSGGQEYAKYYVSADYMDQKGVVQGYDYKRYSIRTNVDVNPTRYLTFGTSSFIVAHNRDGGRANLLNTAAMSPYGRMYEDDGTLTRYPMYAEQLWSNPLLPTTLNPERRQFNVSVNGYAEADFGEIWKPLAGLKYKLNTGFSYVPGRTSEYEGLSVYNMNGWGKIFNRETQTWTVENIVTYSKDIDRHHFDITGLYAAKSKHYQENTAEGNIFPNDELGWGNLGVAATQIAGSYADLYTSISQMGRFNYSYDSRYLFTFTVRRDGSSVFGNNNKYGIFPSIAMGWNIARESFMEPALETFNNLKLRVSYGKSGNEAIDVYQSLTKMSNSTLAMGGAAHTTLKAQASMGNSGLTWESTESFNVGVDFGLWSNRVNGTIDFYQSNTMDLLLKRNLPRITGYENVWANMGKTANTGLEITVNSKNVVAGDFTWSTGIVYSWNKNELKELYGDGEDDLGNRWFLGHPIGVIYDYTKVGIWQEDEIAAGKHQNWDPVAQAGDVKLADLSGPDGVPDGKIDDNDRSILGQTSPKWTGGITNTFTYKDFSLSIFINTVQGALRNNAQIGMAADEMGRRNGPAEIGYWTPENKSNEWRSLSKTSNRHGYGFPYDAGFTRIKDATLSYTVPKNIIRKAGINNLQLYLSGRNLFTFTDWIGWDPEARDDSRGSGDWSINYPVVRSYILGLNITF